PPASRTVGRSDGSTAGSAVTSSSYPSPRLPSTARTRFPLADALSTRRRARPIPFDQARKATTPTRGRSTDALYFRVLRWRQREALGLDAGVERKRSIAHGARHVAVARGDVQSAEGAVRCALEGDGGLRA